MKRKYKIGNSRLKTITRKLRGIFLCIVILFLFYILIGWKIPVVWRIETLKLPKGCKTVYHTKVRISDVYWLHIEGEKVLKYEEGYEALKKYIEEYNSKKALEYIQIYPYGGMSDLAIYDSQNDIEFWQQPDTEAYITINYLKIVEK